MALTFAGSVSKVRQTDVDDRVDVAVFGQKWAHSVLSTHFVTASRFASDRFPINGQPTRPGPGP